jgi:ABC-type protease/lipase transport system fused ATPase/permease subunit
LARALYGNPAIVIMDEPNANLDNDGETALQAAITSLQEKGTTVVLIAHRPSTIVQCNKLLMLDGGKIRAFGPREEVLAKVAPKNMGGVSLLRKGENHG